MAGPSAPKTPGQVKLIFGLSRQAGISEDERRDAVFTLTKKASVSLLTIAEANRVIAYLRSKLGQRTTTGTNGRTINGTSARTSTRTTSRRTVQHRRKKAGVVQVVQQAQIDLMESLAFGRGWTRESLEKFSIRQCGHYPPQTTKQCNSVIEAIKKMNQRGPALCLVS